MTKVWKKGKDIKTEGKIPLQHGGNSEGEGRRGWVRGKITESEAGACGTLGKINVSHLHLPLDPAWRLCVLHSLNILTWEAESAWCIFRLLAQSLVLNTETNTLGAVAELREDEDEAYFSSYGHYGIHEEMLKV